MYNNLKFTAQQVAMEFTSTKLKNSLSEVKMAEEVTQTALILMIVYSILACCILLISVWGFCTELWMGVMDPDPAEDEGSVNCRLCAYIICSCCSLSSFIVCIVIMYYYSNNESYFVIFACIGPGGCVFGLIIWALLKAVCSYNGCRSDLEDCEGCIECTFPCCILGFGFCDLVQCCDAKEKKDGNQNFPHSTAP